MQTNRIEGLTVEQAAQALHISPATVRRRCAAGALDASRFGRAWSITLYVCPNCGTAQEAD